MKSVVNVKKKTLVKLTLKQKTLKKIYLTN